MPSPPLPNCHANVPPPTTTIRYGQNTWCDFYQELQIRTADTIGLFDKHNVIEEINKDQATYAGETLDRIPGVRNGILSYGKKHCKATFFQWEPWNPCVEMMDGYIFTDHRNCWKGYVDVYREDLDATQLYWL